MFALCHEGAARRGLRLIAPDRPGCGASPAEAVPRTLVSHAADMVALADALGIERLGLIGVSGGGPYAAATAAQLAERALVLALVSPVGPLADGATTIAMTHWQRRFFLGLPRHDLLLRSCAQVAALGFRAAPSAAVRLLAPLLGPEDRRVLLEPRNRQFLIALTIDALRQGVRGPLRDLQLYGDAWGFDPCAITAPTIVWQGTEDRMVPPAGAYRLAGLIPVCRLVRLPAGHFWVLEHVDEVLAAVAATLS